LILRDILLGCCRRSLLCLAALDDPSAGVRALDRLEPRIAATKTARSKG
jgi:hypothetical protein